MSASWVQFYADVCRRPMAFLTDLATNASYSNVGVVIYSGNDDSLVSHISSQSKSDLSFMPQITHLTSAVSIQVCQS